MERLGSNIQQMMRTTEPLFTGYPDAVGHKIGNSLLARQIRYVQQ